MSEIKRRRNIILTGIPRSGTTLLAAIVDHAPDAVALNEPPWQYEWARKNRGASPPEDFARWLVGDFVMSRQALLHGIPLPERRGEGGAPVTDYYRRSEEGGVEDAFRTIPFLRPGLSPDFTLAVKHNGLYLGALRQILETQFFEICAILRDPVDAIDSWNRSPVPMSEGKIPGAVIYWDRMNAITRVPADLLDKQVMMYDLMCERIYEFRECINILRYEDLVRDAARFCRWAGVPPEKVTPWVEQRPSQVEPSRREAIVAALRKHGRFYSYFYTNH